MSPATPVRVVLVEDSPLLRERLTESLAAPGRIEIVAHADGETAALEHLRATGWDALVLDLQLRQGTGIGLLRSLRASRPAGAVVIVFTNYAIPRLRERSLALGADYFFEKARDFNRVREVLEALAAARTAS
ncbi:MAG TPA: response regulator [Burkholderiales bacterium]|nr:response regulator [Burkholderiales bacterium]